MKYILAFVFPTDTITVLSGHCLTEWRGKKMRIYYTVFRYSQCISFKKRSVRRQEPFEFGFMDNKQGGRQIPACVCLIGSSWGLIKIQAARAILFRLSLTVSGFSGNNILHTVGNGCIISNQFIEKAKECEYFKF